jgi:hypothetical protein
MTSDSLTTILPLDYVTWLDPIKSRFERITLPDNADEILQPFVKKVVEKKKNEKNYIKDPRNTEKRFTTGFGGEMAVGVKLGMNILDFRVDDAAEFEIGDLSTIDLPYIGVKTIEYDPVIGKFPIVLKLAYCSEIILFKSPKKHTYMIAGIVTPDIIRTFCTRSLIFDPDITEDKEGFYGIPFCQPFSNYSDLFEINKKTEKWIKDNKINIKKRDGKLV